MQPEASSLQQLNNPLETLQPGEELICEIKRSPIGLFIPYAVSALIMVASALIAIFVPYYVDTLSQQAKLGSVLGALLAMVATLLYVYITTLVYTANRWIVTSDSLTQISQTGLTVTQSSQLALDDLEDVTVNRNGLFQMLLGYGTLHAETAGEHSKFVFTFCPNPDEQARKILAARETLRAQQDKASKGA